MDGTCGVLSWPLLQKRRKALRQEAFRKLVMNCPERARDVRSKVPSLRLIIGRVIVQTIGICDDGTSCVVSQKMIPRNLGASAWVKEQSVRHLGESQYVVRLSSRDEMWNSTDSFTCVDLPVNHGRRCDFSSMTMIRVSAATIMLPFLCRIRRFRCSGLWPQPPEPTKVRSLRRMQRKTLNLARCA